MKCENRTSQKGHQCHLLKANKKVKLRQTNGHCEATHPPKQTAMLEGLKISPSKKIGRQG